MKRLFRSIGKQMQSFGKQRMTRYLPENNGAAQLPLPDAWREAADEPLIWGDDDAMMSESYIEPPADMSVVRRSRESAPVQRAPRVRPDGIPISEKPTPPLLASLLDMHRAREAEAQAKREAAIQRRESEAAEQSSDPGAAPSPPRPRRRAIIQEFPSTMTPDQLPPPQPTPDWERDLEADWDAEPEQSAEPLDQALLDTQPVTPMQADPTPAPQQSLQRRQAPHPPTPQIERDPDTHIAELGSTAADLLDMLDLPPDTPVLGLGEPSADSGEMPPRPSAPRRSTPSNIQRTPERRVQRSTPQQPVAEVSDDPRDLFDEIPPTMAEPLPSDRPTAATQPADNNEPPIQRRPSVTPDAPQQPAAPPDNSEPDYFISEPPAPPVGSAEPAASADNAPQAPPIQRRQRFDAPSDAPQRSIQRSRAVPPAQPPDPTAPDMDVTDTWQDAPAIDSQPLSISRARPQRKPRAIARRRETPQPSQAPAVQRVEQDMPSAEWDAPAPDDMWLNADVDNQDVESHPPARQSSADLPATPRRRVQRRQAPNADTRAVPDAARLTPGRPYVPPAAPEEPSMDLSALDPFVEADDLPQQSLPLGVALNDSRLQRSELDTTAYAEPDAIYAEDDDVDAPQMQALPLDAAFSNTVVNRMEAPASEPAFERFAEPDISDEDSEGIPLQRVALDQAVMREAAAPAAESSSNEASANQESDEAGSEAEDVNIEKLARDVYARLRGKLRIEQERRSGRK